MEGFVIFLWVAGGIAGMFSFAGILADDEAGAVAAGIACVFFVAIGFALHDVPDGPPPEPSATKPPDVWVVKLENGRKFKTPEVCWNDTARTLLRVKDKGYAYYSATDLPLKYKGMKEEPRIGWC